MGEKLALWEDKGQLAVQNTALSSASAEDKANISRLEKLLATQKDRIKGLEQVDKERADFFDRSEQLYQERIKMCKKAVKDEKLRSEAELLDAEEARDMVERWLLEKQGEFVWLPELVHGEMEANQSLLSELGEDNVFDDQEGLEDRQNDQHLEQFLDGLAS
ncbi:hypothetical protein CBOM_00532 [Ceraceosorus bombacis]|uniref:Uncharacterized protein n=1 Tax=Ceraceosorus bombacis TaxID=401625 RepID=A0A0P1BAA8_9BASI|nr:hypothetical protein CBOM_00532 [Ceraceosorus bombacis]